MEPCEVNNPNCIAHSEAIARIEANTAAIKDHLRTLNERTGKTEEKTSELERRMAAQEANDHATAAYRERYEAWKGRVCEDMESIKNELAERRGGARGVMSSVRELISIVGVVLMIWMAWSAHQQSIAAQIALQQTVQHQGK